MHKADPGIPPPYDRIAWAEPDGLLGKRNRLLIRAAGQELAHAQSDKGNGIVAINCEGSLEFGNRVSAPPREAQEFAFDPVHHWVARRGRQSLRNQLFCALQIGSSRSGIFRLGAIHKCIRQSALRLDRAGVERQGMLEEVYGFLPTLARS